MFIFCILCGLITEEEENSFRKEEGRPLTILIANFAAAFRHTES